MISELRSALAAANEKIRCLEAARASMTNVAAVSVEKEEEEKALCCSKCSKDLNEADDSTPAVQPPVQAPIQATIQPPALPFSRVKKIRDEWSSLLHEKREIQHKLAKSEQLEKDFEHKISLKKQKIDRMEKICLSNLRYVWC